MTTRPTNVRPSDSPKPADGTYVLRAENDESAVCVLVVRGGQLEVWLYADGGIAAVGAQRHGWNP